MDGLSVIQIDPGKARLAAAWRALLTRAGIREDPHLEHTVALADEEGRLYATGSCFGATLRCLAVDPAFQGAGLLAPVVTALTEYQFARGNTHLFLYTKPEAAELFTSLGFHEIARVEKSTVFMENRRDGFAGYLASLARGTGRQAAVVMNANPFTRGHRHLIEQARAACDTLHLFLVSEDASEFPFAVRKKLVCAGVADLSGILLHETSDYLISRTTFPSYFLKEAGAAAAAQAALDARIFLRIASVLSITARFVGEEPFSPVTSLYNDALALALPAAGVALYTVPRLAVGGQPVSASRVRALLRAGELERVRPLVPDTTWRCIREAEKDKIER